MNLFFDTLGILWNQAGTEADYGSQSLLALRCTRNIRLQVSQESSGSEYSIIL